MVKIYPGEDKIGQILLGIRWGWPNLSAEVDKIGHTFCGNGWHWSIFFSGAGRVVIIYARRDKIFWATRCDWPPSALVKLFMGMCEIGQIFLREWTGLV